ncbi:arylesterase [bacterium]|nr:MAG: arylesterase [bacterium]
MSKNRTVIIVGTSVCLLSLFIFLLSGCVAKRIKNVDSQGKNIICFGDSITLGVGSEPKNNYPVFMSKMMLDAHVINAGIEGDTTQEALKRLQNDALNRDPLLVIIELGGNDFLHKIPFDETIKNVEEIIKSIQAKGAMVAIADINVGLIMGEYGAEYRRLSDKYNAIFIPNLFRGILTDLQLKSDFLHPNSRGYQIIAHRVYRAILPYLNQNRIIKGLRGRS